jgi:hypothetical protein
MLLGRLVRVSRFKGAPNPAMYVVAESDPDKALAIVKEQLANKEFEYEDVGQVSQQLLNALNLKPGDIAKT